jgi:two-component system catabolic regulation response regulator CreB
MNKPKILVVDDQPTFLKAVCLGLENECLQAIGVALGGAALEALRKHPDTSLVLVDLGLPDMTGYDLFRRIRSFSKVSVMFLTNRETEADEVAGLEMGAEGYLKKSIGLRAVVAHVKSMLRIIESRAAAIAAAKSQEDDEEAEFEIKDQPHPDFRVDTKNLAIYYKGIRLELTASQYAILSRMVQQPRRVFSPDMILDWINPDGTATERSPYNHIFRLRRILERVAPEEKFLKTHPTNGYSLI